MNASRINSTVVWRVTGATLLACAAVRLAVQLHAVVGPTEWIVASLTVDDTYYYLQMAWNQATTGVPTFDGIHRTNGVQFLWYWWCVGLAWISPNHDVLLRLALVSCATMNACCFLVIWRLGRLTGGPVFAVVAALAWFMASATVYLSGMENSLHALLLLWLVLVCTRAMRPQMRHADARSTLATVAALSTLVVWTRLDSAIVAAPLFLLVAVRKPMARISVIGPAVGIAVVGAVVMFGGYYWMAGTVIPVSGLIKTAAYEVDAARATTMFRDTLRLTSPFGGEWGLFVLGAAGMVGALALRGRVPLATPDTSSALQVVTTLFACGLAYLIYLSGLWESHYSEWCRSPAILGVVLFSALGIDAALRRVAASFFAGRQSFVALVAVGMAWILTLPVALPALREEWHAPREPVEGGQVLRYRTARWIREHLPAETILASENTGVIGFFSERRSINLDGLINNPEYARTVLGSDERLAQYLERERVDYLLDLDMWEWARVRWPRPDWMTRLPRIRRLLESTGVADIGTMEVVDVRYRERAR